jgi:hypothetical protein
MALAYSLASTSAGHQIASTTFLTRMRACLYASRPPWQVEALFPIFKNVIASIANA